MDFTIIYSNRKTISLSVNREGNLVVRAPRRATLTYIQNLIHQRQDWIAKAIEQQQSSVKKIYAEGELFLYLGREYPLHVLEGFRSRVVFDEAFYISKFKLPQAKKLMIAWYRHEAQRLLNERVMYFAARMGLQYKKITIRDTSSRWGSCSSKGNLNFSFRLVLAPPAVLDYVVVHELAHLRYLNHSQSFWELVLSVCPEAKTFRRWLKDNGQRLQV